MRSGEENPLDLNNFPEDYSKQALDESSTTTAASTGDSFKEAVGLKKKKKEGKDESDKVYECRFCSLKFCKSQALGGHMNRHRQERETETLNRARELVFSTDTLPGAGPPMGLRDLCFGATTAQPMLSPGANCFQQGGGSSALGSDPRLHSFRPLYPRHQLPTPPALAQSHYLYPTSPSTHQPHPGIGPYQQSTYVGGPGPQASPPLVGDYYIGRVLPPPGSSSNSLQPLSQNYSSTCFGPSNPTTHNFSSSPEGTGGRPPFGRPPNSSAGWVAGACSQRYGQHHGQHHEHGI